MKHKSSWSLLGIPDQEGVAVVGGRLGAVYGPEAFRKVFSRFKGKKPVLENCTDQGDVQFDLENPEKKDRLRIAADFVKRAHSQSGLSVVIGGSHEHGFSHLLGVYEAMRNIDKDHQIACINLDAHLDVRKPNPNVTSGSPFYLAIEQRILSPDALIEFGIQSHCNSSELWNFVESKKIKVVPFEKLRNASAVKFFKKSLLELRKNFDSIVVSFDLDSVSAGFAPGVSAPQAEGFTPSEAIEMMEIAGADSKVTSLGIFELNPLHDLDGLTARLAATTAYHFIEKALDRKG